MEIQSALSELLGANRHTDVAELRGIFMKILPCYVLKEHHYITTFLLYPLGHLKHHSSFSNLFSTEFVP
jgi:hypothetical protein